MDCQEFPQVVGLTGEEAKNVILQINPNLQVQIVPEGSMVTMDFRTDRVRIFVDGTGIVRNTPRIG